MEKLVRVLRKVKKADTCKHRRRRVSTRTFSRSRYHYTAINEVLITCNYLKGNSIAVAVTAYPKNTKPEK